MFGGLVSIQFGSPAYCLCAKTNSVKNVRQAPSKSRLTSYRRSERRDYKFRLEIPRCSPLSLSNRLLRLYQLPSIWSSNFFNRTSYEFSGRNLRYRRLFLDISSLSNARIPYAKSVNEKISVRNLISYGFPHLTNEWRPSNFPMMVVPLRPVPPEKIGVNPVVMLERLLY